MSDDARELAGGQGRRPPPIFPAAPADVIRRADTRETKGPRMPTEPPTLPASIILPPKLEATLERLVETLERRARDPLLDIDTAAKLHDLPPRRLRSLITCGAVKAIDFKSRVGYRCRSSRVDEWIHEEEERQTAQRREDAAAKGLSALDDDDDTQTEE